MPALMVELPLTTTIMLRAIADIARHNGENLDTLEARLACLQVFALSSRGSAVRTELGYFAARTLLARLSGNAAAYLVERGAQELSGVMLNSLMAEIVSRFSIVVSDRIAAGALPVVGAVGGATINVIFMNHFQQIAQGHFTVRRLEREFGVDDRAPALCRDRRAEPPRMMARIAAAELTFRCLCRGPAVIVRSRSRRPPTCAACARSRRCCSS